MRWSYSSSFLIFAILIAGEVAISAPINVDILLEARSPVTTRAMTRAQTHHVTTRAMAQAGQNHNAAPLKSSHKTKQAKAALGITSPLRAGHFKKASATYRRAALKGTSTFHRTGRNGLVKSKTGNSLDPGTHADHILEAQTVAHAVREAGHGKHDIHESTMKKVKNILNGSGNMAVISAGLNMQKGSHIKARLADGKGSSNPHLHRYIKETSAQTKKVAKDLDKVFKQGGIKNIDVLAKQMEAMNISKLKASGK